MDFGPVSQSSDMLNYGYPQPPKAGHNDNMAELQSKKANFNDSYEDSVFLSNNSWSGKSVQENGDMTDHTGTTREWYPPPNDNSYPRSNSLHSNSVHGNSQHYDRASSSGNYGRSNSSSGQQQHHYDRLNSNSSSGNYERGTNSVHSNGPYGVDHSGQPFDRANSSVNYERASSLGHSPAGYDSLRRRKGELYSAGQPPAEGLYSSGKPPSMRGGSVAGEPYVDFVVTLMRQESGFGFRIVGGTEEGSQVSVVEDSCRLFY